MDFMVFQYPMISVQACLDGILLGILFALIAYGMALQWGVMNIINIAQGDLVILGGYIAYFMYLYGIHPAWGVIVAPIIMYFVGVGLYKLVINKVVDRDLFISILATFGISILFMQLMNFAFGADVVLANSGYGTTFLFNSAVVLPNSKMISLDDDFSFDIVINLAAQAGVQYSLVNPHEYISSNVNGFLNILELGKTTELSNNIVVP